MTEVWIFDTRSSIISQAPRMHEVLEYLNARIVDDELYVFVTKATPQTSREGFQVQWEKFNFRSQTWTEPFLEPFLEPFITWMNSSRTIASVDRNIYLIGGPLQTSHYYNTTNGTYTPYEMPYPISSDSCTWSPNGVCVMDNILYFYDTLHGVHWYDANLQKWKEVKGSTLENIRGNKIEWSTTCRAMREYCGKLAIFWTDGERPFNFPLTKTLRCALISIKNKERDIYGEVKPFKDLDIIPGWYELKYCVSIF